MKRCFCLILIFIITICSTHMEVYAIAIEDSIDITQYSIDDLQTMSAREFREVLAAFEKEYDPFGTYESNPIIADNIQMDNIVGDNLVSPLWTSGNTSGSETGSHEMITARACAILASDIGFFGDSASDKFLISLSISLASLLPDRDAESVLTVFAGHFYDPYTELNFLGSNSNTAKTNAHEHFIGAVSLSTEEQTAQTEADMYEQLGRCLHYLQDVCQPMHATNFTETHSPAGAHSDFETYIDTNIDRYLDNISSVYTYDFNGDGSFTYIARTPAYYVRQAAYIAYEYAESTNIDDSQYKTSWNSAGLITVPNAVAFTALMMYSFAQFANIPLT